MTSPCEHLCGGPIRSLKCGANIPSRALYGLGGASLHPEDMPTRAALGSPDILSMTLENGGMVNCTAALSNNAQASCSGYIPKEDGAGD